MGLLLGGGEDEGRMEGEEIERRGGEVEGSDHNGFHPPKSKFSGYVAGNVQLYRRRNRSSRCLHKVSK